MQPEITISPRLKDYLSRKGSNCIVVDLAQCKTCGGAVAEAFARAAKPKEVAQLKENPFRSYIDDGIEILLVNRFIHIDEKASLDLRTFLGVKDITLDGIHL